MAEKLTFREAARPAAALPWPRRLFSRNAAVLLGRNTLVSCIVFAINLALLWLLVRFLGVGKLAAAALAFVAANSLHYGFAPGWIFRGTERRLAPGYAYFLINAAVGLAVTMALFAAFLRLTAVNYLVARVIVSVFAGLVVFLLNAIFNFRRL